MSNEISPLNQLLLYRNLLDDEVVQQICAFLATSEQDLPFDLFHTLIQKAEQLGLEGNLLESYLLYLIAIDKNPLSIMAEKSGPKLGISLQKAAIHDINILKNFINQIATFSRNTDLLINNYSPTTPQRKKYLEQLTPYFLSDLQSYSAEQLLNKLIGHYVSYGYGKLINHTAFRWHKEHKLQGIDHCDPITLDDLIGYERQQAALIQNTEAFLANKPACHVLLTGDRGTGKSSSVKALVNHYFLQGLRLVEVAKHDLPYFHDILTLLRNRGKKFIIFLDDLSFEEFEIEYKYLKSVMEGGIESKPSNVLIYATSNRMHLIRETWNDRNEKKEDVHHFDTVNEKLSLSDRFGLTLTFVSPSQDEYLKIVEELASKNGLTLSADLLKSESLKWERSHGGRSGRTAQQFIMQLVGNEN